MVCPVRSWIDDRHFARADDVSAGSGECHRPGIASDHPANIRRKADEFTRCPGEGRVKGNFSLLRRRFVSVTHCRL
jgi:hypothetical protein